ncbi:MAG TPA: hypothetical protein DD733_06145, partial [Clostridiales bacterium]|nr:hypothetical protein [Clostridiales bacterium]
MLNKLVKSRITIIAGHYGSGKTNISVNLALDMVRSGKKVSVVDFDIVNPYFRSADNITELNALGVRVIAPEFANTNVDMNTLPKEYYTIFSTDDYCIVDVGGDADGATALSIDYDKYIKSGYTMFYVFNCYRPMTASPEDAYKILLNIEKTSHLAFSGIINNSNIGKETTEKLVLESIPLAEELSKICGLPVLATTALRTIDIGNAVKIA